MVRVVDITPYNVELQPLSSDFGNAIPVSGQSDARPAIGYLGNPSKVSRMANQDSRSGAQIMPPSIVVGS